MALRRGLDLQPSTCEVLGLLQQNFKSVVLWDERDKRVYKEDTFSGMKGVEGWQSDCCGLSNETEV